MKKTTSKRRAPPRGGAGKKNKASRAIARPRAVEETTPTREANGAFPIVGIGASAGGLEALDRFLRHVPERSGMGFVVIQHLDPLHKGTMVELLQRSTKMPVMQAEDRQKVEPNRVYRWIAGVDCPPAERIALLTERLEEALAAAPRAQR